MKNILDEKRQSEAFEICEKLLKKVGVKLNIDGVLSKSRIKELNFERALIVFILKSKGYTFGEIGSFMYRDHATAMNLYNYFSRSQARGLRFEKIRKSLSIYILKEDIKIKIKYHESELKKLYNKLNRI
jgi:hypothetical protein